MCVQSIKDFNESPMFQLSLASKELFHSNVLAWLAMDSDTRDLFVSILQIFGVGAVEAKNIVDGIHSERYIVLREYKNFDFCICENLKFLSGTSSKEEELNENVDDKKSSVGQILFLLENKFKSIPHEAQLKEYQEKAREQNKKGHKCHFVLLSLTDLAVGLNITHTDGVGTFCITDASSQTVTWHFASYKAYSDVVLNHAPLANHYKDNVVQDYAKWVNVFCDYITKETLLSKILAKPWISIFVNKDLADIRLNDIWQKLIAYLIIYEFCSQNPGYSYVVNTKAQDFITTHPVAQIHVGAGFSRGTGLAEVKVHFGSDCLFGIQIQNGSYKRLLETTKSIASKTFFEKKLEALPGMFNYKSHAWINPTNATTRFNIFDESDGIHPVRKSSKAIIPGFGGYGNAFICQWKKLSYNATVQEVLNAIKADIFHILSPNANQTNNNIYNNINCKI